MDEFWTMLDTLDDYYWPDLTAAEKSEDQLTLTLQFNGQTWSGDETDGRWQITAHGVSEHRLILGRAWPTLEPEYPRLKVTQAVGATLAFAAAPASKRELLADLYAVHDEKAWGPFGSYGLGGDVMFGLGIFAGGPQELMEQYQQVLEAHQMRPNQPWKFPPKSPELTCLHLSGRAWEDDSYILAQTFHAQRLS